MTNSLLATAQGLTKETDQPRSTVLGGLGLEKEGTVAPVAPLPRGAGQGLDAQGNPITPTAGIVPDPIVVKGQSVVNRVLKEDAELTQLYKPMSDLSVSSSLMAQAKVEAKFTATKSALAAARQKHIDDPANAAFIAEKVKAEAATRVAKGEVDAALAALRTPPPQEQNTMLSEDQTNAAALAMAFGGNANLVMNTLKKQNDENDARTYRNAMIGYEAEQKYNDRRLQLTLDNLGYTRGLEAEARNNLTEHIRWQRDVFEKYNAEEREIGMALWLKQFELTMKVNAEEFAMKRKIFDLAVEKVLKEDELADGFANSIIQARVASILSSATDPEDAMAQMKTALAPIPGAFAKLGPSLGMVRDQVAQNKKTLESERQFKTMFEQIGKSKGTLGGYLSGLSGNNGGLAIAQGLGGGDAFNSLLGNAGIDGGSIASVAPTEDPVTLTKWGEYIEKNDRLRSLKERQASGEKLTLDEKKEIPKLESEVPAAKKIFNAVAQQRDPGWMILKAGAHRTLLSNLKALKEEGASLEDIKNARSQYRAEYEAKWAGDWDKDSALDIRPQLKAAGLYDSATNKFWHLDDDGKIDVPLLVEQLKIMADYAKMNVYSSPTSSIKTVENEWKRVAPVYEKKRNASGKQKDAVGKTKTSAKPPIVNEGDGPVMPKESLTYGVGGG